MLRFRVCRKVRDMTITIDERLADIDWEKVKADLTADAFDNGRSAGALQLSFERSQHVAIAREAGEVIGTARMLSDGVCNAYVVDVWTRSSHRRRGVGSAMMRFLAERVPGQHIGLQTDDQQEFYLQLGYQPQPAFLSLVVGRWLDNAANR